MDKAIRFDLIKIERGKQKLCQCSNPHYEIDTVNRLVACKDCGAIVDPYEAFVHFAAHYERIDKYLERARREEQELLKYTPRRKLIKYLEEQYNRKRETMMPTCPVCAEPFHLEDLQKVSWVNEKYICLFKGDKNQKAGAEDE